MEAFTVEDGVGRPDIGLLARPLAGLRLEPLAALIGRMEDLYGYAEGNPPRLMALGAMWKAVATSLDGLVLNGLAGARRAKAFAPESGPHDPSAPGGHRSFPDAVALTRDVAVHLGLLAEVYAEFSERLSRHFDAILADAAAETARALPGTADENRARATLAAVRLEYVLTDALLCMVDAYLRAAEVFRVGEGLVLRLEETLETCRELADPPSGTDGRQRSERT